jgi:hypothetical protein
MGLTTIASFSKPTIPKIAVKKIQKSCAMQAEYYVYSFVFYWQVQLEKSI